tara:strand:+ start:39 stop:773 length:735 start_codon:yes stop_codon:yes gene_type:complete
MNVFQILIADDPVNQSDLSPPVIAAMQSVVDCLPNTNHQLLQRPEIESFLVQHFDLSILDLFRSLIPYAYKADLARYCLLYVYGGWYVDLTLKMLTSVRVDDHIDMVIFADRGCSSMCKPWSVQNGLIYSKPGNPIFSRAIERIVANKKSRYYGSSALCPTGPNCFGKEVAAEESSMKIVYGVFQPLTPTLSFNNLMYIAQTGQLIAQHRTSWMAGSQGGDFAVTQLPGVNNYKELWEKRQVYC